MLECNADDHAMTCKLKLDWSETSKGRPVESLPKTIKNISWSTSCVFDMLEDVLEFKVHCLSAQKTPTFLFKTTLEIHFTFCFNDGLVPEEVTELWSCAPTCKFLTIPCPEEVFENGLEGFCYNIAFTNIRFVDLSIVRGPSSAFLKVADNKQGIHISKAILSEDLPYFKKLFAEKDGEVAPDTYDFKDVQIHPFVALLHEIYKFHLNLKHMHPVIVQQAFILAKRFGADKILDSWVKTLDAMGPDKKKLFVETLDTVGYREEAKTLVRTLNRVEIMKLRKRLPYFSHGTVVEINQRWHRLNSMKSTTPIYSNPNTGNQGPSSSSSNLL